MEASCTVQTLRNSCKFFYESDKKKLAKAISKNQVSDPGPSWPSCFEILRHWRGRTINLKVCNNMREVV